MSSIYSKDGFFNLSGWLDKVEHYKDPSGTNIIIITSPRNNGKTFSTFAYIDKEIWEKNAFTKKVAICRENREKMEISIESFNVMFQNKYWANTKTGFIYKLEYDTFTDKNGNEVEKLKNDLPNIGRFVNIANEQNYKSTIFDGYTFLFWDEFNEQVQKVIDLYPKFNNLISTIERYNKPFTVLLLGNKIHANNDIFVKFNLNTKRTNYNEDYIQCVEPGIIYIDVGLKTYQTKLNNDKSLANKIAKYDRKTNMLFNIGGFLEGTQYNVLNRCNFKNCETIYYFTLGEYTMEYGSCEVDGQQYYYIDDWITELKQDIKVFALDVVAYARNGVAMEQDDLTNLADILYNLIQTKKLYYTSFEIMLELEKWIFAKTTLFDNA